MAAYLPVQLAGDNLGQRHRYFNSLVSDAYTKGIFFHDVENVPEISPLDRLFKIDLAAKLRNVEYIVRNLKDDDMLYVSRALRAKWLLEPKYQGIINPTYLDDVLFPQMITTAVAKMKHWLYINLRNPQRCAKFYEHYKVKAFELAMKFLCNCNIEYILEEYPKILIKITPHYLKIFSEKCSKFAKVYFDTVATNTEVAKQYIWQQQQYYNSIKCVLKTDPDVFLEITENTHEYSNLGAGITEYIVKHCKRRFMAKAELYTACLLHIPTVAKHLSVDECEEVILKLARAKYLDWWFSYKNVEPLVKRLDLQRRTQFKKRVFVDKDVGDYVVEWPYPTPKRPHLEDTHIFDDHIFDDPSFEVYEDECFTLRCEKKIGMHSMQLQQYSCAPIKLRRSELDRLFDEFRFVGFVRAFHMLSRRFAATSSPECRRNMMLVLVSKTGGHEDSIQTLLGLMARHTNEPANLRAAVLRSLVKRASVWRLSNEAWSSLLKFGHGLGLDGGLAEADCIEGLHAVIIRHLLSDTECGSVLRDAFLKDFSTLSEYTLSSDERPRVVNSLSRLLINAAEEASPKTAVSYLTKLLNVYKDHKICVNSTFDVVQAAKALAYRDPIAAREILIPLYNAHIARKELFHANLGLRQDEASWLNILRHHPNVLVPEHIIEKIYNDGKHKCAKRYDRFLYKMVLYFNESLAKQFLVALDHKITEKPHVNLARSLVILVGPQMRSYLQKFDNVNDNVDGKRMAAALRACLHLCRPQFDIDAFEIIYLGAKAIVTRVAICRNVDTGKHVDKLLTWPRTLKLAIALAYRNRNEATVFARAVNVYTSASIKLAVEYILRYGNNIDPRVWEIIRPILIKHNKFTLSDRCLRHICDVSVPDAIRTNFWTSIFSLLTEHPKKIMALPYSKMNESLPELSCDGFENILLTFLNIPNEWCNHTDIYVRFLLVCESQEQQMERFEKIGRPFLESMEEWHKRDVGSFIVCFKSILRSLNYTAVYFNTKYASCLPVFEKIVEWMQKVVPIEKHFDLYVEIHLTMLYFKAIRHSIACSPEVFRDTERKRNEGVDIVGKNFGKNIAKELRDLITKYFDSVVELYKKAVNNYINFHFQNGRSKSRFIEVLIKEILNESKGSEARLGYYISNAQKYELTADVQKEINVILSGKNEEILFMLYAHRSL